MAYPKTKTKGKVKLTDYGSWADLEKNPELIEKMIEALGKNEMPPEEEEQPSGDQRELAATGEMTAVCVSTAKHGTMKACSIPAEVAAKIEVAPAGLLED
mgnify:CR=1 FL=1